MRRHQAAAVYRSVPFVLVLMAARASHRDRAELGTPRRPEGALKPTENSPAPFGSRTVKVENHQKVEYSNGTHSRGSVADRTGSSSGERAREIRMPAGTPG